ncbi:MAG: AMP-binding protein [Actinomycetota bacterium]|nr:AMP-binding protein [Actinomycetota bacterium]
MEPGDYVADKGDQPAVIMADSGAIVTYRELDERSKRLAQLFYAAGLRPGDHMAVLLENHPRYFEVYWAAQRSGLYCTPINWHLKPEEAGYIIEDCGAAAVVTSAMLSGVASSLKPYLGNVLTKLVMDGDVEGYVRYETAVAEYPAQALENEVEGNYMFYSSGTTGRPKGIKPPLSGQPFGSGPGAIVGLIQMLYGFTSDTIYLCPAPLYHAAPLGWTTAVQRLGGTVVVMEKFDPAQALALIEQHKVTHAQFVPTHFVRMLKLSDAERTAHDLSSLQKAVHAAAPCPVEVKRKMIEWWGEIIYEFYAGSEGNGFCAVGPKEWLAHPGSVGVPMIGKLHILDDEGVELEVGETGQIWFESPTTFEYHNDPVKTQNAFNDRGWSSLGDVGYLDGDGYLYLTDRVSHMIISGGVNIYPQEVENELTMHPAVADVAVIGVPNADLGEEVKAVVMAADPAAAGPELAAELIEFCRSRLAHYKCPVSVDFVDELPRLPTGKLLKRELRDRYAKG